MAHVAAQAAEVETGLVIHQNRKAHAGVPDIGQLRVQRPGRAGPDAGHVLAHLAGCAPGNEIRRSHRHVLGKSRKRERRVRAIAHAQPAAHTGGEKIRLATRAGRTDRRRRQGLRLSPKQPQHGPERGRAGARPADRGKEAPPCNAGVPVLCAPVLCVLVHDPLPRAAGVRPAPRDTRISCSPSPSTAGRWRRASAC
jgi:hypothetical protein